MPAAPAGHVRVVALVSTRLRPEIPNPTTQQPANSLLFDPNAYKCTHCPVPVPQASRSCCLTSSGSCGQSSACSSPRASRSRRPRASQQRTSLVGGRADTVRPGAPHASLASCTACCVASGPQVGALLQLPMFLLCPVYFCALLSHLAPWHRCLLSSQCLPPLPARAARRHGDRPFNATGTCRPPAAAGQTLHSAMGCGLINSYRDWGRMFERKNAQRIRDLDVSLGREGTPLPRPGVWGGCVALPRVLKRVEAWERPLGRRRRCRRCAPLPRWGAAILYRINLFAVPVQLVTSALAEHVCVTRLAPNSDASPGRNLDGEISAVASAAGGAGGSRSHMLRGRAPAPDSALQHCC
jgi:hypothetical protein